MRANDFVCSIHGRLPSSSWYLRENNEAGSNEYGAVKLDARKYVCEPCLWELLIDNLPELEHSPLPKAKKSEEWSSFASRLTDVMITPVSYEGRIVSNASSDNTWEAAEETRAEMPDIDEEMEAIEEDENMTWGTMTSPREVGNIPIRQDYAVISVGEPGHMPPSDMRASFNYEERDESKIGRAEPYDDNVDKKYVEWKKARW